MRQPAGHHLAELNVGRLRYDPDDRRVRDFVRALDRVNGIGKRMHGFVWMMEGSGEPGTGNMETAIDGDPRHISNLTVWATVAALEDFVWNTVHRQFYELREEWFEVLDDKHFVMWWVPEDHRPTLPEALERLDALRTNGPGPYAFGWAELSDARLWRERRCPAAIEGHA